MKFLPRLFRQIKNKMDNNAAAIGYDGSFTFNVFYFNCDISLLLY